MHFLSDKSAPQCLNCNTMRTGGRYGQSVSLQVQRENTEHRTIMLLASKMGGACAQTELEVLYSDED